MRIDTPFIIGDLGRIMRGDERRAVRPQVMNLLVYLASQDGAMVKSESLLQDLWPNKVVTDATLYNCIAELRRLLDDGADQRRYIETVHKRGYRLLQPTEFPSARRADAEQRLSGNPEAQEALQLGMQRLSRHNLEGWKQAESYFQRAATLDPQNAVAWQKLAESIVAQFGTFEKSADQFYRALQAAERAIALDDSNGFAWISRAKAEAAIAKIEARDVPERRLLGMYQRASELLPDSDDAARELGAFLVRIPNKAAAAIQHLESAVRLDPLRAENHFALGQA